MTARQVFEQQDGSITKAYYEEMNSRGLLGQLAVALFRAQKRSTAAKKYRRGGHRRDAYDVKNWSLGEVCRILMQMPERFEWGWQKDEKTPGFEWVLYVCVPQGMCSFHSAVRLEGPEFKGKWDGILGATRERILGFCDEVAGNPVEEIKPQVAVEPEILNPWERMKRQLGV